MPWYEGPTLLHHLETVYTASDDNLIDVRFPVQYVVRPQRAEHRDYRGYAGTVAAGTLRPGDEVLVLPSGLTSRIERIDTADGPVDEARPAMAVTLLLTDDLDISRGDMICRPHNQPDRRRRTSTRWSPGWTADHPLALRKVYTLKHTTRTVRAMVTDLRYRLDVALAASRRVGVTSWRSTRSAGSRCGPRRRCSPTTTAATASRAASC